MLYTLQIVVFFLLLIDALCANAVAWFGAKWYSKHFRSFSRLFPPAKGWTEYYLALVLWMGVMLVLNGVIG